MHDSISNRPVSSILDKLQKHEVRFVKIGGQAEVLMGSPRLTGDLDICYERSPANLENLAGALRELKVRLRNVPADVPFLVDAATLKMGSNFTFDTDQMQFDILGYVEPLGEYPQVAMNATNFASGDKQLLIIALDDLIRIKEHLKRRKDGESLLELYALKRLRDEQ